MPTKPIALDETLQNVVKVLQNTAETLQGIAKDETLQGTAKDITLQSVVTTLQNVEEALRNSATNETLKGVAKDETLQNLVTTLRNIVEILQNPVTDETLQKVAKDTTLQGLVTAMESVVEALQNHAKDETLIRMAEALDAKDVTQQRLNEIGVYSEEKKQEIEEIGKRVKETIPDDYSEMSEKVNNANSKFANALKGTAIGQTATITDISPIEHTMDVKVRSKNVAFDASYNDVPVGNTNTGVVGAYAKALEKGKTYTFSFDTENTGATMSFVAYGKPLTMLTSQYFVADGTRKSITFTMTDDYYKTFSITWVQLRSNSTANSGLCSNVMIEEGEVATEYTKYVEDLNSVSVSKYGANVVSIANKTISGDKGYASSTNSISLTPNTVYTLSVDFAQTGSKATVGITVRNSSGATIGRSDTITDTNGRFSATFTSPEDGKIVIALFSNITATAITGTSCAYSNFQIEVGSSATEYEPYKEPTTHTPNADGTVHGVTSLYPTTTLIVDTEGTIVDCGYNRDINKAFTELEQKLTNAVISLGGNV